MSLTAHRVIQYMVIITLCTLAGGGYWYWKDRQAKAAVALKTATDTGLVAYWSFDEGSGTTAEDFSPANANTGTLTNGPTWVDGKVGKALSFDGTDDKIIMGDPSALKLNGAFTMSAWIYPETFGGGTRARIIDKDSNYVNGYILYIDNINITNGLVIATNDVTSSTSRRREFANCITLNAWQHVVASFDGTNVTVFVNGVSQGTQTLTVPGIATDQFSIGGRQADNTRNFDGFIDEVRVYNRALSGTEITNLYQTSAKASMNTSENSDLTNGLVGLWSFNGADVSGTTAYDRSGQGNNGTLTNGPTVTTGKIGQALDFDGTNDMIAITDSAVLDTGGVGSWCNWFYTDTNQSGVNTGFSHNTGGGTYAVIGSYLTSSSGALAGYVRIAGVAYSAATPVYSSGYWNGAWHHVCTTFDKNLSSGRLKLYVDGVIAGSNNAASGDIDAGITPVIGAWKNSGSFEYFNGDTDEVRVYNRALSATEIWNLYQAGGGTRVNSANSQVDALERGLAGYWKLDDGSGTSATDASTKGNTGTLTNGPTWTTGQIDGAVSFDGSNDYVSYGTNIQFNSADFTIAGWFKLTGDAGGTGESAIFSQRVTLASDGQPTVNLLVRNADDRLRTQIRDNVDTIVEVTGSTPINQGQWYHGVMVKESSLLTLYVNGVKDGSIGHSLSGDFDANSVHRYIGRHAYSGGDSYLNGMVDEVRVYTRALSAEEIAKLYQSTAPDNPDSGLKGYWSFNGPDVSGTTAFDRSGVGNNGTLTNGPTVALGKIGQALSFDGNNDYVSAGDVNAVDGASTVTLSGWFKRGASNAYLTVGKATSNVRGFNINFYNNGRVYVNVGDGASVNAYGYFTSNDTDWHHVVFVFNGSLSGNENRAKAYLDGVQQSLTFSNTIPATTPSSSDSFEIGRDVNLATYSSGSIDEVRLYSRAFTQTEVTNLYNLGR